MFGEEESVAQTKPPSWRELRVGLFVLAGLFLIVTSVVFVTGTDFPFTKYRLRAYVPDVSGLSVGAPVRMHGIEVGRVELIRLRQNAGAQKVDPNKRVEIVMLMNRETRGNILTDSTATLATEGLLGGRYVVVSSGETGVPIGDQGEIRAVWTEPVDATTILKSIFKDHEKR